MKIREKKRVYPINVDTAFSLLDPGDLLEFRNGEVAIFTNTDRLILLKNGFDITDNVDYQDCRIATNDYMII